MAATEVTTENKNPDKTAGVLMARLRSGQYIILHAIRRAYAAADVRQLVRNTAITDRGEYQCNNIHIPQDPGQAGKEQAASYVSYLSGFVVQTHVVSGSKVNRAEPFAAQWQNGNVLLLAGDWNEEFILELEGFPDAPHDDYVDAASDAFKSVALNTSWRGLIT